ncbi:serine/threonine-protein kinase meng-po [Parasteatoda tepidariorum]|uniref:serine/threonine-protein kinase meng-po n=1 Tax=Parasteatoda tepidariorum TaxID=114398 RepID=UPI001C725C78|nr:serine/threonine-protein kinase meng-po-like [Parasteatoda tepidariorum]
MASKRLCSIHKIREIQLPLLELQDQYDVIREIGSGDYGKVMLAVHRDTQAKVALKAVPKATTTLKDFLIEFHYCYFLSPHNNILDTYDVAFETVEHYVFAQEVAPYGDVWQVIEKAGGMEENDLKIVIRQIASALEFMHSKGLVHRDMRAENMLIFAEDFSRVKLTDFGLTRRTDTLVKKRTRSLPTCPPEIWEAVHLEGYTVEIGSDVWQMGMFIFAGLLARFPWEKADITDSRFSEFVQWQKRKITRTPKDFRKFTPRLHRLLRRLMDPKPSKRYEIKEVYKYLGDKWLICRSPRATTTVNKTDIAEATKLGDHLGDMLSNLTVQTTTEHRETREQRINQWVMSTYDDSSDS